MFPFSLKDGTVRLEVKLTAYAICLTGLKGLLMIIIVALLWGCLVKSKL